MIEIKNVTKIFGKDFKAVNSINLEITEGKIYGFLGPNGAGKTTTLKMLTGILTPDGGKINVNGFDIVENPTEAKNEFAFVSDDPDMFLKLKGIEYLRFVGKLYGIKGMQLKEAIFKYSELFEMQNALNDRIESYSHGMRQKIVIIGVLLHNPKNWIIDEPMTGLDPTSSFELKKIMREHANNGNTVFFSTHILDVAERLCDRIGIINKGKLLFVGTYEEIKEKFQENKSLEELYMEITKNDEEEN